MIGANSGSHGQTGVIVVFVLSPLGPGQLLLVNGIAILATGRAAFFSLFSALGRKVGPGFRPETALAAARGKPNALLAPPKGE
ncbi:hypothetical protein B5F19_15740 [Pseudoflavonifractor sp. An184]|nr:hypothetical protein B5F19_15740 [Pseudoflavonifractor sp. An184]